MKRRTCILFDESSSKLIELIKEQAIALSPEDLLKNWISKRYVYGKTRNKISIQDMLTIFSDLEEQIQISEYPNKIELLKKMKEIKSEFVKTQTLLNSKVVTHDQYIKDRVISKQEYELYFKINLKNPSSFIPALSASWNARIYTEIRSKFLGLTSYDPSNNKIVGTSEKLNDSIHSYKKLLLASLHRWIATLYSTNSLVIKSDTPSWMTNPYANIARALDVDFKNTATQILQTAWRAIRYNLLEDGKTFIESENSSYARVKIINPIVDFYILQNFDECVEKFTGDSITFDKLYMGYLDIIEGKYIYKEDVNRAKSYDDTFSDNEKNVPKLLKAFVSSIQMSDGKPLTMGILNKLILAIHDDMENRGWKAAEKYKFLFDNSSLEDKVDNLLKIIADSNIILIKGGHLPELEALKYALSNYKTAYKQLKEEEADLDWKERAEFNNIRNVLRLLIDTIRNSSANTYTGSDEHGDLVVSSSIERNLPKIRVRNALENAFKSLILAGKSYVLREDYSLDGDSTFQTITTIKSKKILDLLLMFLGVNLRTDELMKRFSTSEGIELINNLSKIINLAANEFLIRGTIYNENSAAEKAALMIEWIAGSGDDHGQAFKLFSDLYIQDDHSYADKLYNQNSDVLPTVGTNNTICNLRGNMFKALELMLAEENRHIEESNLLWLEKDPITAASRRGIIARSHDFDKRNKFLTHINFATDYKINGRTYKVTDLSVPELASIAMGTDYLLSILKHGLMLTQIECYSDKVRIVKGAWNLIHIPIHMLNMDQIQELSFKLHAAYYLAIKSQVRKRVLVLINEISADLKISPYQIKDTNSIELINKVLEDLTKKVNTKENRERLRFDTINHYIAKIIARYLQNNPDENVDFLRDVHFTIKNNGEEYVGLNNCMMYKIAQALNFELFKLAHADGLEVFKKNIQSKRFMPALYSEISTYVKSLIDIKNPNNEQYNQQTELLGLFGYENVEKEQKEELLNSIKSLFSDVTSNWLALEEETGEEATKRNTLRNNFIEKYFELFNLTRDADLQVSLKHMWIHDKNKVILGDTDGNINWFDPKVRKSVLAEESSRLVKGKKRMNAGPASYDSWSLGLNLVNKVTKEVESVWYGVPGQIRTAVIEHALFKAFNHFGNSELLNSHDGAIFSTGIMRWLERHSYSGHKVASTLKIIAINPHLAGEELIKCADYEMSNSWIRNSMNHDVRQNVEDYDGRIIMKKMLQPAILSQEFIDNWDKDGHNQDGSLLLGNREIYVTSGGEVSKLSVKKQDNNLVFSFVSPLTKEVIRTKTISANSTLYDLWQALGGEVSKEYSLSTGELEYSEISQEMIAYLISRYNPSLKEKMIGKLIDIESTKSSQGPENSKQVILDDDSPLAYGHLSTLHYGILQDYSHHSDDNNIPALSLVITAIAFNGENIKDVDATYLILALITKKALSDFIDKWETTDHKAFMLFMAKELLHALKTNSLSSNAELLVKNAIKNIDTLKTLPFSDLQLFYLATSQLAVNLNHDTLRLRFMGQAVVQNPSNGIYGVYEDKNGIVYNQTTIIDEANLWYKNYGKTWLQTAEGIAWKTSNNIEDSEILDARNLVKAFIFKDERFADEKLAYNLANVNIGDHILINDDFTVKAFNSYINKDWTEEVPEMKKIKKGDIIYIDNPFVLYALHLAVQKFLEKFPKDVTPNLIKKHNIQRDLATTKITWRLAYTIDDAGETHVTQDGGNFWLLDSTQKLLRDPKNLEYKRYQAVNLRGLRDGDEYGRKFYYATFKDFTEKRNRVYVQGLKAVGGEEILPKQYKTAQGLKDAMSTIMLLGAAYFEPIVRDRFSLSEKALLKNFDGAAIGIASLNFDLILSSLDPEAVAAMYPDQVLDVTVDAFGSIYDSYGNLIPDIKVNPQDEVRLIKHPGNEKPTILVFTRNINGITKDTVRNYTSKGTANAYYCHSLDDIDLHNSIMSLNKEIALVKDKNGRLEPDLKNSIKRLSKEMYTSWELTRYTISARIPSQSYLSFLPNVTVGYTEEDVNNGYMNIWEMWFLGSKY